MDGDADRVIILDELGNEIDGDQLIALIANNLKSENKIKGDTVVSTVMSNLGLLRYLKDLGLNLFLAPVGDRYVSEIMKEKDLILEVKNRSYNYDRLFITGWIIGCTLLFINS